MMRLLLTTDAVGGVWIYSLELARALRPLGVETVLAVMGPSPNARQREDAGHFKIIDTKLPLDWVETSPAEIRRSGQAIEDLARQQNADVVQVHSAAFLAYATFDQPCVAVQHSCVASWWAAVRGTPLPPEFAWRRDLVERGLGRAEVVVAPSGAFAAETARIYGADVPVVVVHNGRQPVVAPRVERADFVFTASRLWDEGKNVGTLDAAAAKIRVPFEVAGATRGPNGSAARFANLHLLGEVGQARFAGALAAKPIYASAALYEPFGLSVLEAANAGCALVLSDIPTHRELWDGAAVFVQPRDSDAFAETINLLCDDRDARDVLGQAARMRASLYTPEAMASPMAAMYRKIARTGSIAQVRELAGAA